MCKIFEVVCAKLQWLVDSGQNCAGGRKLIAGNRFMTAQIPLRHQQFGVEQTAAGRAADRVVAQRQELYMQKRVSPQPAHHRRHAGNAAGQPVHARLRPVRLLPVENRLFRRAGKAQALG